MDAVQPECPMDELGAMEPMHPMDPGSALDAMHGGGAAGGKRPGPAPSEPERSPDVTRVHRRAFRSGRRTAGRLRGCGD